jgi:hypothetical protein
MLPLSSGPLGCLKAAGLSKYKTMFNFGILFNFILVVITEIYNNYFFFKI